MSGQPTKVLALIPDVGIGGAQMDLVRILPRLDRARFEVMVCAFLHKGTLAPRLTASGIDVFGPDDLLANSAPASPARDRGRPFHPPNSRSARYLASLASALASLQVAQRSIVKVRAKLQLARSVARLIHDAKIDLVHTVLPGAYLLGMLGNVFAGRRPLVMSRVSLNGYHQDGRLLGFTERKILHPRLDMAVGNSSAILQELRAEGIPERKLRLIYNGIDFADFAAELIGRQRARELAGIDDAALVLSSVANLHAYKGHADLLHALGLARERLPADWVLLAAGRDVGDNLASLRALARNLGIAPHVRFLGERVDVPTILSAADIHVSASHTEGLPNNILEAMCAGLPIVATSVGGVPEQIMDGECGILVPPKTPDRLAAAVVALANDAVARQKLGGAARERVRRAFRIERAVSSFEEVYGNLDGLGCRS